eukprot:1550555-Pyramimonas_sp.AAC.2
MSLLLKKTNKRSYIDPHAQDEVRPSEARMMLVLQSVTECARLKQAACVTKCYKARPSEASCSCYKVRPSEASCSCYKVLQSAPI